MAGVKLRGKIILLAALLVGCSCLEIPRDTRNQTEAPGCGGKQCSADGAEAKLTSPASSDAGDEVNNERYADVTNDDAGDVEYSSPMPALKRQPTEEEMEAVHKQLVEELRRDENPEEPPKHVLERWGFYDTPTFGELDMKRDKAYAKGINAFEKMIKDDRKLTKREKESINAELERFLDDDHNYQVWSAHVYKQETKKRKKRGIPESEIHSYFDMPNPYYKGKK